MVLVAAHRARRRAVPPGQPRRRRRPGDGTDARADAAANARTDCVASGAMNRIAASDQDNPMRRGYLKIRGMAAWGCLTAAMAFGVAACGGDDRRAVAAAAASSGGGGKTLSVYSSLPLQGASRPQSEDVINGEKLALKQKGNKCGDFTIKYVSLDDSTAAAGKWEAGTDVGQRAQGRAGRQRDRLPRRVQLGRFGDLDPDHQRGRHPAGQPVQHGVRPDEGRRRAPSPASRTSTTRPASATTGASCRSTPSRAPPRRSS